MTIQHEGSVFEFDDASPESTMSGSKSRAGHCWKFCPYSVQSTAYNGDTRIPEGDKTYHPETEGQMHSYSLGGGMGWVCADNACAFFLNTFASTISGVAVPQAGRRFQALPEGSCPQTEAQLATLSGIVNHRVRNRTIISGSRYYEI